MSLNADLKTKTSLPSPSLLSLSLSSLPKFNFTPYSQHRQFK